MRCAMVFLLVLAWWGASPAYAESRIGINGDTLYGWCKTTPGGVAHRTRGQLLRRFHQRCRRCSRRKNDHIRLPGLPAAFHNRPADARDRRQVAGRTSGKARSHCPRSCRRSPVGILPLPVIRKPFGRNRGRTRCNACCRRKLDLMVEKGHIGRDERDILEAITDAGSAAAHRGFAPNAKTLGTIIETAENFLHREFVLKTAAGKVRTATPSRQNWGHLEKRHAD